MASCADGFLTHEVKAADPGNPIYLEMATNRHADPIVQARDVVGLGEDRLSKSAGREIPFWTLLDRIGQLRYAAWCLHSAPKVSLFRVA